jgi:hypothetical protein
LKNIKTSSFGSKILTKCQMRVAVNMNFSGMEEKKEDERPELD